MSYESITRLYLSNFIMKFYEEIYLYKYYVTINFYYTFHFGDPTFFYTLFQL